MKKINALVTAHDYQPAIDLCLSSARHMKTGGNWEAYLSFMLRAAEIETFEVWKARSFQKYTIHPDYRRPLAYLDTLDKQAGKYLKHYPYLEANTLFTKAVVYGWLFMADTAEQMHNKALKLRMDLYGKESREVADSYLWLAILNNWELQRKDQAKVYYLKAQDLQKKYMPESRYALGSTYYGLATIARKNFEFDEAEVLARQYISLYYDLPYELAAPLQLVANISSARGDYEKSIEARRQSIGIYEASGFSEELIILYSSLSDDLIQVGRVQEAKAALNKGLMILNHSPTKSPGYITFLYENLGNLFRKTKQYDSAKLYFNAALQEAVAGFGKKNVEVADAFSARGQFFQEQHRFDSCLNDFQQMLITVIPDFHTENILTIPKTQIENPYFSTIIAALFHKGDALMEWYSVDKNLDNLKHALDHYRAAYEQLMVARTKMSDELSKPILMLKFSESIERSIRCAKILYEVTSEELFFQDIFHFIELTKYLNVLDALQKAERAKNSGIPKHLIIELDEVKAELNIHQKAMLSEKTPRDSISMHREAALNLIDRRRKLMTEISGYPEFATSNLDNILMKVNEVQRQLSNDEQILEFYWGKDSIYTLSITKRSTAISSLPQTDETTQLLTNVYHLMSSNDRPFESQVQHYSDLASKVYKLFFAPVTKADKLIIIPDGLLSLIPAEALVKETQADRKSFNELDYLIYHHEISYAYSATILYRNTLFENETINNVLAFSYSSAGSPTLAKRRNQQVDLPGTFKELEALSRLFKNVTRFTDADASKINFINNTLGHDIIHLGVHGIGDQEVADNSRLIFRNDSLNDGELYAYEIYNLNVDARLVVLSACESGKGRNQTGEGMFSIARAFAYAGCPSLVMSLWQARDAFTSEIMIAFYEKLNGHESITSSMRNAKLQFLKESDEFTAHPSNWAPFVVNGQDMTFNGKSSYPYWVYIGLIFLVVLILFIYARNRLIQPKKI